MEKTHVFAYVMTGGGVGGVRWTQITSCGASQPKVPGGNKCGLSNYGNNAHLRWTPRSALLDHKAHLNPASQGILPPTVGSNKAGEGLQYTELLQDDEKLYW